MTRRALRFALSHAPTVDTGVEISEQDPRKLDTLSACIGYVAAALAPR